MGPNRGRRITDVVNVGEQSNVKNDFVLGYPQTIDGTDYVRVPLYRDQSYDMSYYSKSSGGNEVNYLFLNNGTGGSKWLTGTTDQLFVSDIVLFEKVRDSGEFSNEGGNRTTGIMYAVVENDTDGDNRLSEKDEIAVASSLVDGSNYKKLIDKIDRLYALKQIANDKVMILYQKNRESMAEIYEVPSMNQLFQGAIPKVNLN